MSRRLRFAGALLPVLIALHAVAQIPEDDVRRIRDAAPAAATVQPKQQRVMLVFNRSEGFQHGAIPYAARALEILGTKTGAFTTVQSDDLSMLLPENLKRFDAVCFNNTTQLKIEDPRIRTGLLEFIAGGKGIVGIHAATDNFPTWNEGQELFGGVFDSHPWTAEGTWAVRITDPSHPVNSGFGGKDFAIRDEIYRVRQVNLRSNARVLLALDMRSARNRGAAGVRTSDKDIPISWVRTYGKGRLFYCSLGHNEDVYWNPAVLRHYLDGIQFAIGDLPAVTTPVPFDPQSVFDRTALKALLQRIATYRHGEGRGAFAELNAFIRWMDDVPEAHRVIEQECLNLLRGSATPAAKQFICEKLHQIGTEASVGTLAGMLADPATAEMALYALEGIPGSAADETLLRALGSGFGGIGTVNVLGHRRVAAAVTPLAALVTQPVGGMTRAAVSALGAIGTREALRELGQAAEKADRVLRADIQHAMLSCAEKMQGDPAAVLAVYRKLSAAENPASVRAAAFRGLVLGDRAVAGELILRTLLGGDTALHPAAAKLIAGLRDIYSIRSIAARLRVMSPGTQVQVLASLEAVRDTAVQRSAVDALGSADARVRAAATRTLAGIGDGSAVMPLARAAASWKGDEQKEARAGLVALSGPGVPDSLEANLSGSPAPVRVEILKAMGERGHRAMTVLLAAAADESAPVRAEAARALRAVAGKDDIPAMVELLVKARDPLFRREMELAAAAAARRSSPPGDAAILAAYPAAKKKQARVSLISVLGRIGSGTSLPLLRETLAARDADIRREALRALSAWPTAEPFPDLWSIARTSKDRTDRILALRGSVRLISLDSSRSADELVRFHREAMRIAPDTAERQLVLSALSTNSKIVKRGETLHPAGEPSEDYFSTWEFSGPYGEPGEPLLDRPFAPELGSGAQWSPLPRGGDPARPWQLELDRLFRGEDFVVYLRAAAWSPADSRGRLQIRTTDAVRVWWNGSPVHSSTSMRSFSAPADTIPVDVRSGWNGVMLKLEQGEDPWRAALRLRAADGAKLEGIRTAATQQ